MRHLLQMMLMCAVAFQAACTSVVWNGGVYDADRAIDTHITHTLAHDQIHAFGRTATGHLLMMGERHWYAVRDDVSQDLQRVLQAQLPAAYQITLPYTGSKSDTLPIVVHENQQFSSQFCLDYAIQNAKNPQQQAQENHILRQMQFQQQINPNLYRKCFAIVGSLHAPLSSLHGQNPPQSRSKIAVQLQIEQQHTQIQSNKLARNILLTPLALMADVAGGLVMLPALILGDLLE